MKTESNKFFIGLICFFFGSGVSYFLSQFYYFEINNEIDIFDLIISVITIIIGIYLTIVIDRQKSKSQNFYNYVENKYDSLWNDYINFASVLDYSSQIEITETSKWFKKLEQKLNPLQTVFKSFEYDDTCLVEIEKELDELENYLNTKSFIQKQIIYLDNNKVFINEKVTKINELFALGFKKISDL